MNMERLIIFGASGHGRVTLDAALRSKRWDVVGFVDDGARIGSLVAGVPVLGGAKELPELVRRHRVGFCVVSIGDNAVRNRVVGVVRALWPECRFASIIHPTAVLSDDVEIGGGSVVFAGGILNSGCKVGAHCIVNTGSQLDHDCVMEDFSSLAPRAATGGNVRIGEGSVVSLGVSVIHGIRIGRGAVIGAGAVVVRDIPDFSVAMGVPARVVRQRTPEEPYL